MAEVERPWDEKPKGKSGADKIGIGCTALLFGACIIGVFAVFGGSGDGDDGPDEFGAQVACENVIADGFKSPDSADFGEIQREPVGNGWKITGIVDAENSFGASLRHDFSCIATPSGTDEWSVDVQAVTPR